MTNDDWFAPKRFGYGAGMPLRWQGWALLIGFMAAALAGGVWLAPRHPWLFGAALIVAMIPMLVLSARHTRGGWRWRSGD